MTTTYQETRSLQLWPRGTSVNVTGTGDAMLVKFEKEEDYREPTQEERHLIEVEELARRLADTDIFCCDSSLVDDCIKMAYEHSGEFFREWSYENVQNVYADPSDWTMEQCKEWLDDNGHDLPEINPWDKSRSREFFADVLEAHSIQVYESEDIETLRAAMIANMDDETIDGLDDWREAVRDASQEQPAEIYEWWRVSRYLAGKLADVGECVMDNNYGEWWGRQATGQAYIMDGTLQKVAQSILSRR